MMKSKDIIKKILRTRLFVWLLTLILRVIFFIWWRSMRVIDHDSPVLPEGGAIYLGWHENISILTLLMYEEVKRRGLPERGCELYGLSSAHPDSKLIVGIYRRYGYNAVYGSSRRGGSTAVLELINLVKKGNSAMVTPDGPKGPRREVKEGGIYIAMKAGAPLVPIGMAVAKKRVFDKTWDKMCLPRMVWRNHVHVVWGKPIMANETITPQNRAAILQKLSKQAQQELDRCTAIAEAYLQAENSDAADDTGKTA
ncbi:MAG: DUF374 domain-containing protein [Alphaproteobacteria bacterium]|nr:DUF374 domain-containing protein [Alphaproteobacteria bacterium]